MLKHGSMVIEQTLLGIFSFTCFCAHLKWSGTSTVLENVFKVNLRDGCLCHTNKYENLNLNIKVEKSLEYL